MHEAYVLVSEVFERPSESVVSPKLGDCVIVPECTENVLRFSARLDNGLPEVRLKRVMNLG
jgi:hypothetical protein